MSTEQNDILGNEEAKRPSGQFGIVPFFAIAGLLIGLLANFSELASDHRRLQLGLRLAAVLLLLLVGITAAQRNSGSYNPIIPLLLLFSLAVFSAFLNWPCCWGLIRWTVLLCCYWAMARISSPSPQFRNRGNSLLFGLCMAGAVFSVYALKHAVDVGRYSTFRASIPGVHPNHQAFLAGLASLAATGLFMSVRQNWYKFVLLICALPTGAAMVLSGSRTMAVAFLLGLLSFLSLRFGGRELIKQIGFLLVLLFTTLITLMLSWSVISDPIENFIFARPFSTLSGRVFVWDYVLDNMFRKPIAPFGLGPGLGRQHLQSFFGKQAHNGYLQLIVDLGPLSIIPLFIFFVYPIKHVFCGMKNRPRQTALYFSLLICVLAHAGGESDLDRIGNGSNFIFIISLTFMWQLKTLQKDVEDNECH